MDRYDIKADLVFARKAEGFKMFRLGGRVDDLMKALGVEGEEFSLIKAKFMSVISLIDDKNVIAALIAAYSLDESYNTVNLLSMRRKMFAQDSNISVDKMLILEESGINEIVKILTNKNNT